MVVGLSLLYSGRVNFFQPLFFIGFFLHIIYDLCTMLVMLTVPNFSSLTMRCRPKNNVLISWRLTPFFSLNFFSLKFWFLTQNCEL